MRSYPPALSDVLLHAMVVPLGNSQNLLSFLICTAAGLARLGAQSRLHSQVVHDLADDAEVVAKHFAKRFV
jgi:hypothetical protein